MKTSTATDLEILIPERGRPDLLEHSLKAVEIAKNRLKINCSVHVLINGADIQDYRTLRTTYANVHWRHERRPLGYHSAIAALLRKARAPWVYLLNSDMLLEPDALVKIMQWRSPDVFAIASQILPYDTSQRREETGWTVPVVDKDARLELHDLIVPDEAVRSHVYAGGGASLFQRAPLQRYVTESTAYAPFYFEDADWGLRAWADNLLVLHCPASRGVHMQHATIDRYHSQAEIKRISQRNLDYFRFRYGDLFAASRGGPLLHERLRRILWRLDTEHRRARRVALKSNIKHFARWLHCGRYPTPQRRRPGCLQALLVSPFSILPPAHGGARRIVELIRASSPMIDWTLLQDEATSPADAATNDDHIFRQIYSIPHRPDTGNELEKRWAAHAHEGMSGALAWLLSTQPPDVLCFEHVECVGLIEALPPEVPFIWTLHDAGRDLPKAARDRVQASIDRATALIVTVANDLGFWSHPVQISIENGASLKHLSPPNSARPPGDPELLLMVAPLRYPPNHAGLRDFLTHCWPTLIRERPSLRLRVLAGRCEGMQSPPFPIPPGVEIIGEHVDPTPQYATCTLAINAQGEIEGSSIKVLEALAHSKVMVTTASGARGLEDLNSPALVRAKSTSAMAPIILELLNNSKRREEMEARALTDITPYSWENRAKKLIALLQTITRANTARQ